MPAALLDHAAVHFGRAQIARDHAAAAEGLLEVLFSAVADAELAAYRALPAVAADQVRGAQRLLAAAGGFLDLDAEAAGIFPPARARPAKTQFDVGQRPHVIEEKRLDIHLIA